MRQEQAGQFDIEVDVAGNQVVDGGRAASVRHVGGVHAGLVLEQFTAQVRGAARPGGRIVELVGVALGVFDQRGGVGVGRLVAHAQRHGTTLDERNGRQVARRVERHGVQRLVDRQRREVAQADGVAVGFGGGDLPGADVAAGAWLVVHHNRYAQRIAQLLRQLARARVRAAACRVGHDELDGLRGIRGLCPGVGGRQGQAGGEGAGQKFDGCSSRAHGIPRLICQRIVGKGY
ncbi:hypothetical protein D3C87_1476110 [compost metagenome]